MRITLKGRFVRDLKRLNDRRRGGLDMEALELAIERLADARPLPSGFNDHALWIGWQGYREFHLGEDDLVVYQLKPDEVIFRRAGTHAELFPRRRRV